MVRYRFIKTFNDMEGNIPEGSDITILDNGSIYFNGGLVHMAYQSLLKRFINNPRLRQEYLVEEDIPYNKV